MVAWDAALCLALLWVAVLYAQQGKGKWWSAPAAALLLFLAITVAVRHFTR